MTTATLIIQDVRKTIPISTATESAFWKDVGKELVDSVLSLCINATDNFSSRATILFEDSSAVFNVGQRGTFIDEDGEIKPSIHIHPVANSIALPPSIYEKADLRCINGRKSSDGSQTANNYKKYILGGGSGSTHTNCYGRIGDSYGRWGERMVDYPSYAYWPLYFEKLSKGYKDYSQFLCMDDTQSNNSVSSKANTKQVCSSINQKLYKKLFDVANNVAQSVFKKSDEPVTRAQAKECRRLWNLLGQQKTVDDFNRILSDIMCMVPRRTGNVSINGYAHNQADFAHIITREDSYIHSLESVVGMDSNGTTTQEHGFENMEVYVATDKQKAKIMAQIPSYVQVKEIYRVIDHTQKNRFDNYCKQNNISVVKEFWHGSKRCNWLSIVKNGLSLNPNAQITGKMLGNGCYFAPSFTKSYRYLDGQYWAGGNRGTGFMGVYAVAYGKPLKVSSSTDIRNYTKTELSQRGYNCVHALGGAYLQADEICVYDESAMLLNYIVEVET